MKTLWNLTVVFAAWVFVGSGIASKADSLANVSVSGTVIGASGVHTIHVALWDSTGFMRQPVQEVQLRPGAGCSFGFSMAPGRWAISAFEDINENGACDMGLLGPKEPSGFLRPFHAWHKPRFDEVAAQIDHDISNADVKLR